MICGKPAQPVYNPPMAVMLTVETMEQGPLLTTVRRIIGRIDIENNFVGHITMMHLQPFNSGRNVEINQSLKHGRSDGVLES